jgi:uncharacterized iron-regulated membrane protein
MLQAWLLRFHRWVALVFALPLLIVVVTGLILSFEPWLVTRAIAPGSLDADKVVRLIEQHDPKGQARALVFRTYDRTLTISAGRGAAGVVVDVDTARALPGPSRLASFMTGSRRMHETLLVDAGWLVVASTVAMLVLAPLGLLMGMPRRENTLSGWHKGVAWGLLPLVVLSPLTGIFIAMGLTFAPPRPAATPAEPRAQQLRLADAVRVVGKSHDLSALIWLRSQGGRLLARLMENGESRVHVVTAVGTLATPRNWPRLWHEGNFAGGWSALMNIVTSLALLGLLGTGVTIWARRTLRLRARQAAKAAVA